MNTGDFVDHRVTVPRSGLRLGLRQSWVWSWLRAETGGRHSHSDVHGGPQHPQGWLQDPPEAKCQDAQVPYIGGVVCDTARTRPPASFGHL